MCSRDREAGASSATGLWNGGRKPKSPTPRSLLPVGASTPVPSRHTVRSPAHVQLESSCFDRRTLAPRQLEQGGLGKDVLSLLIGHRQIKSRLPTKGGRKPLSPRPANPMPLVNDCIGRMRAGFFRSFKSRGLQRKKNGCREWEREVGAAEVSLASVWWWKGRRN